MLLTEMYIGKTGSEKERREFEATYPEQVKNVAEAYEECPHFTVNPWKYVKFGSAPTVFLYAEVSIEDQYADQVLAVLKKKVIPWAQAHGSDLAVEVTNIEMSSVA